MKQIGLYLFFIVSLTFFHEPGADLFPYRNGEEWGYSNANHEIKINCVYDRTYPFKKGIAVVYQSNKGYGLIDETGKEIASLKYTQIEILDDGMVRVTLFDKFGFLDNDGREVIPPKYDSGHSYVPEFSHGVVRLRLNGKWGALDKTGKEIVPFIYEDMSGVETNRGYSARLYR